MGIKHWLAGIRLYIGIAAVVVAAEVWWWAAVTYGGGNLSVIRAEEVYAWLALACLLMAVSIGPLLKLVPNLPGKPQLRDARRLIGISAALFAALHAGISYLVLFHGANPLNLAYVYKLAFALGAGALLVLLLMAFTSFDKAFFGLGIWWFRLHRLVYVALFLGVMHAFMVGSHASSTAALWIVGSAATLLLCMHVTVAARSGKASNWQLITLTYAVLFALALFNYGLSQHLGHNILLHLRDPEHVHG